MREGLGGLGLREPVIHRPVEMVGNLRDLAGSDQRADGDQAAIAGRQVGTQPQVTEQDLGRVLHDARHRRAELLADAGRAIGLRGLVEQQKRG